MKRARYFVILHLIIALYSVSAIFSKLASMEESPGIALCTGFSQNGTGMLQTLPLKWMLYYAAILFILFFYAIAWQQIIKKMPIVTAYANKAVLVIWGIIWGFLFFDEKITVNKVVGALVIIAGVYLVVSGDEYPAQSDDDKNDTKAKEDI